ncbi:hypothetical protein [Frankia sp. Cr1]|uniref:hypothetical protein n=1 Tax=Frankia sp. Cr1 TaxID=3073931 RepID=UPI002AD56DB6|nr:hypothetical protein [Frankia sp. Cr1]
MADTGGRPTVGGVISTAVGEARLARVDEWAAEQGRTRAAAIRELLDAGIDRTRGWDTFHRIPPTRSLFPGLQVGMFQPGMEVHRGWWWHATGVPGDSGRSTRAYKTEREAQIAAQQWLVETYGGPWSVVDQDDRVVAVADLADATRVIAALGAVAGFGRISDTRRRDGVYRVTVSAADGATRAYQVRKGAGDGSH